MMKEPAFTVILPHRRNPGNDKALAMCLSCLMDNTANDFMLIMDAAVNEPLFPRINRMIQIAKTSYVIYLASDTFVAPRWDVPIMEATDSRTIVTGVIVEPGAIAPHHLNKHADFGRKPETFRRAEFEQWCENDAPMLEGRGWPGLYAIPRSQFLLMGGFDTEMSAGADGFSYADIDLWDRWEAAGNSITRVKSFAYHLQRFSDEIEQVKDNR